MVISSTALAMAEEGLKAAGFAVGRAYCMDKPENGKNMAVLAVEKTGLSRLDSTGSSCRAEVTVSAKLYAAERSFMGAAGFSELCERAQKSLYFGSDIIISRAELSELKKDMQTGRLTRTLTMTAVYTINREEALA